MKYKLLTVKKSRSNRRIEIINYHGSIRNIKIRWKIITHTSFDLKVLGRLIKSNTLLLKVKLHQYLGIDFNFISPKFKVQFMVVFIVTKSAKFTRITTKLCQFFLSMQYFKPEAKNVCSEEM